MTPSHFKALMFWSRAWYFEDHRILQLQVSGYCF